METTPTTSQRIWKSVLYGGAGKSGPTKDNIYVINVYSLIALVSAATFGALHIVVEKNFVVGPLELACAMVILANMLALRLYRSMAAARTILLAAILALMAILLISGGTQDTGIFWLFVFPIIAFFLEGKSRGIWWVGGLYVLIAMATITSQLSLIHIPYSLISIRQLLVSLTVVGIGVYIYQGAREAALKEVSDSQRDLQEYLDQTPSYNVKVGIDGQVMFANKTAKESSRLGRALVGSKFLDAKAWASNEAARQRAETAFHEAVTGKSIAYDEQVELSEPEGLRVLIVNFTFVPIFKDEQLRYILVEARDVTVQREADRTKAEFTSIATEQLKPSMLAIRTAAEKLRASLPEKLTDEQYASLQQISRHTQYIGASINNMTLVSGLELGNLPVHTQKLNMAALCQSVLEAVRIVHLKDRSLEINEDYADSLPEVAVDFELMRTILDSLILNAVKFTPDTGHVNIRVSQTEQKLTPDSRGSIQIEVQDSGRGIPEDQQKLVFTKFFRAKNNTEQTGNSGQGLYITKKLLDYVGGSISFTSKENIGTIFIVLLPLEGMRAGTNPTNPQPGVDRM